MTPTSPPEPGALRLIRGNANPQGMDDAQLFLFAGNPTIARIQEVQLGAGVVLPPRRTFSAKERARVKVLHFNDLHGHICRLTPHGDIPVFSKMVGRIRAVREQHRDDPNTVVMVMSAGDDLIGFVFDELLGEDEASFKLHVGYELYSKAGVDVCGLGNHDLDLGVGALARSIRHNARFPLLSANLLASWPLAGLYYPAALFISKGVRIGVIGLTTAGQMRQQLDANIQIASPVQTVYNLLPVVRPLCDVVIVLSHLGYSRSSHSANVQDAGDVELARTLPRNSVQLIVGGHTHHVLNEQGLTPDNIVNGIPIVQAGTLGQYLGEVDITLQEQATVTHARLLRTSYLPTDEAFEQEQVKPLAAMAMPMFNSVLGRTANDPDLSTDSVRNLFAAGESAFANFITDAMVARARAHDYSADLAIIDASSVRIGLPVGRELTFGDWFNVMPFADMLRLCWLTGAQIKRLVEDNALRIDRPCEPHTERGFIHFSRGLRYAIALGERREDARAYNIRLNDAPIESQLHRSFLVACSSFIRQPARAWEGYEVSRLSLMDIQTFTYLDTGLFLRDELVVYIREHGGVTAEAGAVRDGRLVVNGEQTMESDDRGVAALGV